VSRKAIKIETKDIKLILDNKEEGSDIDKYIGRLKEILSLKKKIKEERIIKDIGSSRLVEKNIKSKATNIKAKGKYILYSIIIPIAKYKEY